MNEKNKITNGEFMKFFLATVLTLTSISSFALTSKLATDLVKASQKESISSVSVVVKSNKLVQVNYIINDSFSCSSTVSENATFNEDDGVRKNTYEITQGQCRD